jgi:protein Mpv17
MAAWHLYSVLSSQSPVYLTYAYILTLFSKLLLKRPLTTQCVTSAVLFASGDIIAQQAIEPRRAKHDVRVRASHPILSFLPCIRSSSPERPVSHFMEVTLSIGTSEITSCLTLCKGCLFGPPASKWIALLNQLRFASPTKAVIYRVRVSALSTSSR